MLETNTTPQQTRQIATRATSPKQPGLSPSLLLSSPVRNVFSSSPGVLTKFRGLFRYAPTRRYAGLIAVCAPVWLLSGTSVGEVVAVTITVLLVLIGVYDAIRIPNASHVALTRSLPPLVGVNEEVNGAYTLHSSWPTSTHIELFQQMPSAVQTTLAGTRYIISDSKPIHIPVSVTGVNRGLHPLGNAAVAAFGSLGLIRKTLIYYPNDTISVIPAFRENRRYKLAAVQQRMQMAGARTVKQRGMSTSFSNLRDYVVGDDPRHIHWKASARRGRLISKEFTVEQGQTIMIAVDAGRMMTQMAGDKPRFEYALSSALTLADVALTAGDRVGLMIFNEEVREYIPPARTSRTLMDIRDALIRGSATLSEPDYAAAFRSLAARQRRRAMIVLFTDVIDVRSSRAVIANTTRTAARHLPLVVALRNEQLTAASLPSDNPDDLTTYASAAAEELLSARDEAILSMRQAGVAVLDTSPNSMTAGLINRYLEIKDRSLL